jgi:P-type Ca2+ transporter type 2C
MKIADLVHKDLVNINLKSRTSDGVIQEIVDQLYKSRKIKNKKHVLESLLKRERLGSTGLGDGVAIPHARIAELKGGLIFVGVSKQGINFPSIDQKPVYLVILFLTPLVESETHLKIISRLAALLDNKLFIRQILGCSTNEELYRSLKRGGIEKEGFISLSKEEIYLELASSDKGITEVSAKKRLEVYGANRLKTVQKTPLIVRFLSHLTNLLAIMMWVCSGLCFWALMPEAGWACIAVVFINAIFSFWQEFKAEKAIEALSKLIPSNARLIREGNEKLIPTSEIVPGDVIMLEEGDNVPADARLIESAELRLNNSAFSGESKLSYKFSEEFDNGKDFLWLEMPNLVFAGTSVSSGMGKAVVIATGMGTEIGKIAYLTQTVKEDLSPLQKEVNRIGKLISFISVVTGLIFFFFGLSFTKMTVFAAGMFAIGIITANVPQGLMPTLTLALAMAVQRMSKRKALIKKLSSVETLGCANVICTDKTGTLTTNQMCVRKIWINDKVVEVSGSGYEPAGEFNFEGRGLLGDELRTAVFNRLINISVLCNTAKLNPPTEKIRYWSVIGDPTEAALLVLAKKADYDVDQERLQCPVLKRFPFESIRKRMSSIHTLSDGYTYVLIKGSPKEILELSSKVMFEDNIVDFTQEKRRKIEAHIDGFAEEGLRVLGFAFCKINPDGIPKVTAQSIERDLVFVGVTGMYDPPRPEVKDAVSVCKKAGIRVVMITGDYQVTALSIAKQVGIVSSQNYEVISGADLAHLSDEQLKKKILDKEIIFARATPEHKLRVVNTFKELGNIVAVTGDGVNDAPALKRADIGVAMGLRGTDVAKESAEMILLDDNFASIVYAIEEGRAVFDNIKKFITYIFAHLVPEGIPFIFYVLFKIPVPITVLQILAIDLGTEIFPALALGAEKPEPGIMNLPPRPKNKGVIDKTVLFRGYIVLGLLSSLATLSAYYFILFQGGWKPGIQLEPSDTTFTNLFHLKAMTILFVGIVVMQVANVLNCRSEKYSAFRIGFFSNLRIFWSVAISFIFTCILVYVPCFQKIFNTTGLGLSDWGILFIFMLLIFALEELRKRFLVDKHLKCVKL